MFRGAAGLSSLHQEAQAQVVQVSVRFDVLTRHPRAYSRSHSESLERSTIAHLALKPHSPNVKSDYSITGLDDLAHFHVDWAEKKCHQRRQLVSLDQRPANQREDVNYHSLTFHATRPA
jgi:hypothetical protein